MYVAQPQVLLLWVRLPGRLRIMRNSRDKKRLLPPLLNITLATRYLDGSPVVSAPSMVWRDRVSSAHGRQSVGPETRTHREPALLC